MSGNRNTHALLVELMIAVLFFALCATVLIQTFAAARELSGRARSEDAAMLAMEDLAEQLYAAADFEAVLAENGFLPEADGWTRDYGEYCVTAAFSETACPAGRLLAASMRAYRGEYLLAELPAARYVPGEGTE